MCFIIKFCATALSASRSTISAFCLLTASFALILCGCGGGGGSGGSSEASAQVSLELTATEINTGDFTTARIEVYDLSPRGVLLKVRYPLGLSYVKNSSVLTLQESHQGIAPATSVATETYKYLVYRLAAGLIPEGESAVIEVTFKGTAAVEDGVVEVDADVDDGKNFRVSDPLFTAEDDVEITVAG